MFHVKPFCFNKDNEQSFNLSRIRSVFYLGFKENKIEQINFKKMLNIKTMEFSEYFIT